MAQLQKVSDNTWRDPDTGRTYTVVNETAGGKILKDDSTGRTFKVDDPNTFDPPTEAPETFPTREGTGFGTPSTGDIRGQGLLLDMGSPYKDGFMEPVQLFLLQNENFRQAAEMSDEPALVDLKQGDKAAGGGRFLKSTPAGDITVDPDTGRKTLVQDENVDLGAFRQASRSLQALRTNYRLKPFRIELEGLLMEGPSIEFARNLSNFTAGGENVVGSAYPGNKINRILTFEADHHLLAYASTTTVNSGQGSGIIRYLTITNFDWDKDNEKDNAAPFRLELQTVASAQKPGLLAPLTGGPKDGGTKTPR